jgi:lysozyme family protein
VSNERFRECLAFVLKWEGGYVNDPLDAGGATNKGITQRTFTAWLRGRKQTSRDVKTIRDDEVESIYFEQYWTPIAGERMNQPVDLVLFDAAVQHGASRAIRLLQEAMQMPVDGALNQATLNSAMLDAPAQLAQDVMTCRAGFYKRIVENNRSQAKFAEGWANRLEALEQAAGL